MNNIENIIYERVKKLNRFLRQRNKLKEFYHAARLFDENRMLIFLKDILLDYSYIIFDYYSIRECHAMWHLTTDFSKEVKENTKMIIRCCKETGQIERFKKYEYCDKNIFDIISNSKIISLNLTDLSDELKDDNLKRNERCNLLKMSSSYNEIMRELKSLIIYDKHAKNFAKKY